MHGRQCNPILTLVAALTLPLLFLSFAVQGGEKAEVPFSIGQSRQETKDPGKHAWDMEVFNRRAKEQLEKLGKLIVGAGEVRREHVAESVTQDFSCGPLRPERLAKVFED